MVDWAPRAYPSHVNILGLFFAADLVEKDNPTAERLAAEARIEITRLLEVEAFPDCCFFSEKPISISFTQPAREEVSHQLLCLSCLPPIAFHRVFLLGLGEGTDDHRDIRPGNQDSKNIHVQ